MAKAKAKAKRKTVKKSKTWGQTVTASFDSIVEKVENLFASEPTTTVEAIKQDHEGLKSFIGVLKDPKRPLAERKKAYRLFSTLLKSHSMAEETAVYKTVKKIPKEDLKIKVAEGEVEHNMADDLLARIAKTTDSQAWGAHVNVLAEIVEHHMEEEERDMLPLIRRNASDEMDETMLMQFMDLRKATQKTVEKENAGVLSAIQ